MKLAELLTSDSDEWSISALAGGETKVAIQVTFNAHISATGLTGSENNELLGDILAATAERAGKAGVVDAQAGSPTDPNHGLTDEVRAGLALATLTAPDAVAPVALGYAIDAPTTIKVDENMIAASQVRIGRSSSVKAPE
ncbi:hypothetical protein [Candidatus Poriferisodalis sp.]|uniref:hypothetical protein n=1 Tax=Candidatus Poriferisodalis sp. TaxID=3101277 RepID=UPI003B526EB5